jgi:hypothetical protein
VPAGVAGSSRRFRRELRGCRRHKMGFRETGVRRPLPTNPALEIVEMHCEL